MAQSEAYKGPYVQLTPEERDYLLVRLRSFTDDIAKSITEKIKAARATSQVFREPMK